MDEFAAKKHYVYKIVASPIGDLRLVGSDRGLAAIVWESKPSKHAPPSGAREEPTHRILVAAERQLSEYFAGKRKSFDLELDFEGTAFQKSVWGELLRIPFGETRTYGEIAKRLGDEKFTRAVGAANGANPIPIVVPCHRVIGASGRLVGFGGGLDVKAHLLGLERGAVPFQFAGA